MMLAASARVTRSSTNGGSGKLAGESASLQCFGIDAPGLLEIELTGVSDKHRAQSNRIGDTPKRKSEKEGIASSES